MIIKSPLLDEIIIAGIHEGYGLTVSELEFLPIGNDPDAWVYKVHTPGGSAYFLKVRRGDLNQPSLSIPRWLRNRGIEQIIAPLPTRSQQLSQPVEVGFHLILYPFIDGDSGMNVGLTDAQWHEFGTLLKNIHATPITPELQSVRREKFDPNADNLFFWFSQIGTVQAGILHRDGTTPAEHEMTLFWREKHAEIGRILARTEALAAELRAQNLPLALCHADIHTANVMVATDGRLFIIDWDGIMIAPVERDLMFILEDKPAGKPTGTDHRKHFFSGYGATDLNRTALAYYRYEWVVQEIADYAVRVFLMGNTTEWLRYDALRQFRQLFDPGDVVEAAYEADKAI
jgi:spectinomycin phosphotransferase